MGKSDHIIIEWNFIVKYDIIEADDKSKQSQKLQNRK